MDSDGTDDFIIIDSILQNENHLPPSFSDLQRWADGQLPTYGIAGWASGVLDFPVVGDGNGALWTQYYPSGSGPLPTNIIIGADFVLDFFEAGYDEDAIRCCVEKNLCEGLPPGFIIPSTGTSCDTTFDCQVFDRDLNDWRPVCTD